MKLFILLLLTTNLYAQDPNSGETEGVLTRLSGTPDVVEVEDLQGDRVAIEADGSRFLISFFSNSGAIGTNSKRNNK